MINSLQIAKTGMQAQQTQLDVISHNLANVATAGFKRGTALFEDLIYQNLRQVGGNTADNAELPTGLQIGLGVRTVATARSYSQGNLQQTDNNLDIAINGNGFFRVQLPDGSIAYTRDGSFKLNAQGQVVTNQGYLLVDGITVPENARSLTIGKDGVVSALVGNAAQPQVIGQITLANFINPAGLEPLGQNLFLESAASGAPAQGNPGAEGFGQTLQGFLESSNVNVVQELVNMIQTQRAYELNSKAVTTSDQMLQRLTQL
ncbi:flagellar basal-body rod protein FlgG [Tepidimonas charontis]|uniref:Flagellar basal-body rod protein FlgG n=1 Tax=Tepidimonas charontis TaxID=2267262 RepID=A0A554XG37_9BURK|nr:flagellar basal-body rod protein FlgG [Tepidimonas charontis]TSE34791.1 Flagellar basal-body rod protein FlgG [Tepidimonas charontis]